MIRGRAAGASLFDRALRQVTPGLGQKHSFTAAKAQRVLDRAPRPAATTLVDCANCLLAGKAI